MNEELPFGWPPHDDEWKEVSLWVQGVVSIVFRRYPLTVHDAADVSQNVAMKLHVAINNNDVIYNLSSWVYRVATTEALLLLRSRKRLPPIRLPDPVTPLGGKLVGDEPPTLAELLAKLPDARQQEAFRLKYEDLGYEEIAQRLEVSTGTAWNLVKRAIEILRSEFGGE